MPNENIHNPTGYTFNNEATVVEGPTGDDDEKRIKESMDDGDADE